MSDNDECIEEDNRTFVMAERDATSYCSPSKKSSSLELNFAKVDFNSQENEEGIQEQPILVVFELPDGSVAESYVSFKFTCGNF